MELALRGDRGIAAVAKELGVSAWTLRCRRKLQVPGAGGAPAPLTTEQKDQEIR